MEDNSNVNDFNIVQNKLFSAVIADILDDFGYRNQVMKYNIRPIHPSFKMVGRAFTMLATDIYHIPNNPYKKELEAIDRLAKDDIVVATTNGSISCGFWGELLSTAAIVKGARGAVIDGLTRDSNKIVEMGFPVFTRGYSPNDSKGRCEVISYNSPIQCGEVIVNTGDIIFADHDGVVVVPQDIWETVFLKAINKVSQENEMKNALQNGMGVVRAFQKYGIL